MQTEVDRTTNPDEILEADITRRMLEAAAEVAGVSLVGSGSRYIIQSSQAMGWIRGVVWDPLNDDGDRYRLAVAARLFGANRSSLDRWVSAYIIGKELSFNEALRLAIVRAAAEIGLERRKSK